NSRHNSNMELTALGLGNIASVLFGGIPATGAIARTTANVKNGAKTPIAGMVHALVLLLVLLVLMPLAEMIPMPTIAAILLMVAYNMSEWKKFLRICKSAPRGDIIVMLLTFALTVIFDLVIAIELGMLMAALLFMKRMSEQTEVTSWRYIENEKYADSLDLKAVPKNVRVYEITGPMFFGAADKILDIIFKDYTRCLVLRMRAVNAIDATAMHALEQLYEKCKKRNIALILSHVNTQPLETMKKYGFYKELGPEFFCSHIDEALELAAKF
ncbi:MAG: SulP family inorganic anion transporter, partial [Bacillota bacterium]|nr:SulP family inorganic anion transporter [Bacillota bacterium]